jgi:transposase
MKTTSQIDARKVDQKTLQYLRDRAISLKNDGKNNREIAKLLGIAEETVSRWYSAYKKAGDEALRVKKTGRPKQSGKILTIEQEKKIISMLVTANPKQLQFKYALWTRESVKALIDREFEVDMAISTVGYYLKRWEFTSKKPIKRAYERNDEKALSWMEIEYPNIKKRAKKEKALVWWADETSCVSLPNTLKGYAPKGSKNKPILTHTAKKFKINMISAITNTGKTMFSLYDDAINVESFIEFLQKTIDSTEQKVFMILDNLRVHHAKLVKAWLEDKKEKIELFYIPAYSPDLNPDEYLNQDYKKSANSKIVPTNKKELEQNTLAYMKSLIANPQKVANFFKHPSVRYAA